MFKLESYITPILLSYVDKYIKNFKLEDSQVSLWGGDASFHNLDLRLEVLEQELQLPFSFVSGHIHELLIHVPWTKLASEPITITINTIECILKLRETDSSSTVETKAKEKQKKVNSSKRVEVETPPGYVQSLVNKIVSNIRISCNNLILKYVEEDIVLSTNVKLLTFESADDKWKPAYTAQVVLRKLITLNDLTVCLDKRNAAGKIDIYQEPMLYRCSVTMHLLRVYNSSTANRGSTTRLDIYCNSMEFSMTEQQVPMVIRLVALVLALKQREIKSETEIHADSTPTAAEALDTAAPESWAGWAWSFVPSILPANWDDEWNKEKDLAIAGNIMQIGFYVDDASLTFKVSEASNDRGYYSQKKMKYWPLLTFFVQGIYVEVIMHGCNWLNVCVGVSEAVLIPVGCCSCSHLETPEGLDPQEYLKAGFSSSAHKSDSLFDSESVENKGQRKSYDLSWDNHMSDVSEASLLERTPAMALDYVYYIEKPADMTSERISELGGDPEYRNLSEKSATRVVLGPTRLCVCSGFLHRIGSLQVAASAYDYVPYSTPKLDPSLTDLLPPSEEDYDALLENIPIVVIQVTIFAPVIELQLMDHQYFQPMKGNLFRKRKKISSTGYPNVTPQQSKLPKLTFECQCIDFRLQEPLYNKRLIHTVCQLPEPPAQMFDMCYRQLSLKVLGFCSRLILTLNRQTTIITPSSVSCKRRLIVKPQYWINPDVPHDELIFESECFTVTATKAKVMVISQILTKITGRAGVEAETNVLFNSSLLHDASRDCAMPYLELCIEDVRLKTVATCTTYVVDMNIGSVKMFIFDPIQFNRTLKKDTSHSDSTSQSNSSKLTDDLYCRSIEQVLIFSGPERKDEYKAGKSQKNDPGGNHDVLFVATLQFPVGPKKCEHAPLLIFNLQEIQMCIDPLLCNWLQYTPRKIYHRTDIVIDPFGHKSRNISKASGNVLETPRRIGAPHESIHSSSDRDQINMLPRVKKSEVEMGNPFQDQTFNFLKEWFHIWKGMIIFGDVQHCTVYFPIESLSAEGYQGIQQAVDEAVKKQIVSDILVLTLPHLCIKSLSQKQSLLKYISALPVKLPDSIWTKNKSTFPWTLSLIDLSCHSLHTDAKFDLLKSVSLTATVGLSTRPNTETNSNLPENVKLSLADKIPKQEIASIGICVHIDMTPINICVSDVQICLLASIMFGLMDVADNLKSEKQQVQKFPEYVPAYLSKAASSSVLRDSISDSSEQSQSTDLPETQEYDVKLTAWIQWTIARFTLEIISFNCDTSSQCTLPLNASLKLVLLAEDIVSSLDFQSVYLKIKSKIGSANIHHFVRYDSFSKWKPGPFLGLVMKAKDELYTSEKQEDTSFISITLTRACCQHAHFMWGAAKKQKQKVRIAHEEVKVTQYITEIVVHIQPVDFIISLATIRNFYAVLNPLLQLPTISHTPKSHNKDYLMKLNNQTLPLLYLESRGLRIIIPSAEHGGKVSDMHDFCMFQYDSVDLRPTAVNPICRTPARPDIYQAAAHSRILNVPGSELEDRQYELNVTGTSVNTGLWSELDKFLDMEGSNATHLRTMNENPALEWNNLGQSRLKTKSHLSLCPVVRKFDISIVAAPAMIYKKDIVICGHSMEINFTTNIEINLSISQIRLAAALMTEFLYLFEPFLVDEGIRRSPKIRFPYAKTRISETNLLEENELEPFQDSGFETSDLRSSSPRTVKESLSYIPSIHKVASERSSFTFPRPPNPVPLESISVELLFTGGKISFILYDQHKTNDKRSFKERKRNYAWKPDENETGYEASEEGSLEDYFTDIEKYSPLLFVSICQPNAYLFRQLLSRKVQISFFDLSMKISSPESVTCKEIPCEDDFHLDFLQTKVGYLDPSTGIPPAFFTMKYLKSLGKPASLDIIIARPMKLLCSITRWTFLMMIKEKICNSFRYSVDTINLSYKLVTSGTSNISLASEHAESFTKFNEIKTLLRDINNINLNVAQIMLIYKTESAAELRLCVEKIKSSLSVCNRPEKVTSIVSFECLSLGVSKHDFKSLLLNPWTISLELCLYWETWQKANSQPQMHLSAESDCIVIDVSSEHIKILKIIATELEEFVAEFAGNEYLSSGNSENNFFFDMATETKDQHYKDDLRAGAFQFVDASLNNTEELPLPYQVLFWNHNIVAMAWRYPQPRALTKVRVFPVPFKLTTDTSEDQQVLCHLEYWSDCHNCYLPYLQFDLSEHQVNQLDLPESNPNPVVASVWRVALTTPNSKWQNIDFVLSPRALAACMRIDSYFNKSLVPDFTFSLRMLKISVSLHNYYNKLTSSETADIHPFNCDMNFPETQCFLLINVENVKTNLKSWSFRDAFFDTSATMQCLILDYEYLTQQIFLMPFAWKLEVSLSKTVNVNFISKPVNFNFGPSIAHTLTVSAQIWNRDKTGVENTTGTFVVMTRYVICNDTHLNVRFGQVGTDEDISLPSRFCHLYCWRSQKSKPTLRMGIENGGWIWSKPFHIDCEGTQMLILTENNSVVVVTVKCVSNTQKQIIFSGQLVISNMLLEHFEFKVVKAVTDEKDKEFRSTPSYIANSKSTPPSLLIDTTKRYFLRLRFFGLESAWSGDIPLMENTKCAQPWLVKVPLQERGQFLSIWCKIVTQNFKDNSKILVVLWPLFMVRSNLPVNSKVRIETPTLNVHLDTTVRGKGELQQLYCPGTVDHSHQLSFQLAGSTTKSNPYVPLNYSLVDQKEFFKKAEREDINQILSVLSTYSDSKWPYLGDDLEGIEWITEDQPLTHVQVRYQNVCQYSTSLLVELLPWCLLVNILGCQICIIINEKELFRVCHHGIVTPPKIEETFHIGVCIGDTWNMSPPLQLAKSNWSQTFYMPKITGTIPEEGTIQTTVRCNAHICMLAITSSISNEIRLLKISSTHVFTSYMSTPVKMACFAVPDVDKRYDIPGIVNNYCFTIAPNNKQSGCGISLLQWLVMEEVTDANSDFCLYISFSTSPLIGWSCPVRVDKVLLRKSVVIPEKHKNVPVVLTSQEYKGQIYLSLHEDSYPQLLIKNLSGTKLVCGQFSDNANESVISECQHFNWSCTIENSSNTFYTMPTFSENFPDVSVNNFPNQLCLAADPQGDPLGYQWSAPLSITNSNFQYIRIPSYGDVRISTFDSGNTVLLIIESVAEMEISAKDIRIRLSLQNETKQMSENQLAYSTSKQRHTSAVTDGKSSDTTVASSYVSADETFGTHSEENSSAARTAVGLEISREKPQDTYAIPDNLSDSFSPSTPAKRNHCSLRFMLFVKSVTVTLTSDLERNESYHSEVANFTVDNIALSVIASEALDINFTISDLQLDNQMFNQGQFDFPVVLFSHEMKAAEKLNSLDSPVSQLIEYSRNNAAVSLKLEINIGNDNKSSAVEFKNVHFQVCPLSIYVEDTFITRIIEYLRIFTPTKLVIWSKTVNVAKYNAKSAYVRLPNVVIWESQMVARPLYLRNLGIEPLSLLLSVHSSVKMYIALDKSPLQFSQFERTHLLTTPYRLGHALTMHYLTGAIFGAGWVVGSLELLGSPGGLARAMGSGLRDFVSLPYQGLLQGPWAFLRGVTHGSASLMKHLTAGTLQSVTKLASSVARNLDRLTLDEEHLKRAEEQRRQRPQGVAQGFVLGLTGFGISLLGAVGGIAHHPLQSVMSDGASPRSLAAGVGLGIVGMFTKPLSGAAELVALTGQGLLQGAGWNPLPEPRLHPVLNHTSRNSIVKYSWKFMHQFKSDIFFVTEATYFTTDSQYEAVALILTTESLIIINTDDDITERIISLSELYVSENSGDPTLLSFKIQPVLSKNNEDECVAQMDPACRARVADFVRSTNSMLLLSDDISLDQSEMSGSPTQTPDVLSTAGNSEEVLSFYVNPQSRNYFLCLLYLAKQHSETYCFSVL